ncbi:MAG: hypothetical protein ACI9HK_006062, partial [Pirellulaceae bacterium]
MTSNHERSDSMNESSNSSRYFLTAKATLAICFVIALLIGMPGCSGCWKAEDPIAKKKRLDEEKRKEKKKKEEEKEFDIKAMVLQPSDDITNRYIKPGHIAASNQLIRSNKINYSAELETAAGSQNEESVDVLHTRYKLRFVRAAPLPKGQVKNFEALTFIPANHEDISKTTWLHSRVRGARGGRELVKGGSPTISLRPYQYYFVVLSTEPDSYTFLKTLSTFAPPQSSYGEIERTNLYSVLLPKIDGRVPVPTTSSAWTSTAYVIWDGLLADDLTPEQQEAMVDWLHWGGQLIISGPESLDKLRGSFLAKYLPAESGGSLNLNDDSFAELNQNWSLSSNGELLSIRLGDKRPLAGLKLDPIEGGQFVPNTGDLVAERRLGLGRIVATAFPLTDSRVKTWGSIDGFINNCLLRKPRRQFKGGDLESVHVEFADFNKYLLMSPNFATNVRYFSRDVGDPSLMNLSINEEEYEAMAGGVDEYGNPVAPAARAINYPDSDDPHFCGYHPGHGKQSSMADWDPESFVSDSVRASMKDAKGISIPSGDFVIRVLAVYLAVLVPLNWLFFRLMNRVEWAWVAAPLIAIVGAVVVVRMAQLDIGFASSRTEIGVLEVQGEYHRGHLTRYTSIYTSLSTTYTAVFDDRTAIASPLFDDLSYIRPRHVNAINVQLSRGSDVRMEGFTVQSNSSDMFHSEQMFPLGGKFSLTSSDDGAMEISNSTKYAVKGAVLVQRTAAGAVTAAYIGDLLGGETTGKVRPKVYPTADDIRFDKWEQISALRTNPGEGEISIRRLIHLAIRSLRIVPGESRLVGYTDVDLPGFDIEPRVSQSQVRTMVLVHLDRPRYK